MRPGVTVVIPTIPPRRALLSRALHSVGMQDHAVAAVVIEQDADHQGAAATRNRGLHRVDTEWTAFLDDDDEWMPHHTATLLAHAAETGADVLWPWFEVVGGTDPFPQHRGRAFLPSEPHIFPICVLVRTEMAQATAGFREATGDWHHDDLPFYLDLWEQQATFTAVDHVTWKWHHHGGNTSGKPERWQ